MNSTTSETRTNTINEQNDNKISLKDLPALMVNESNIVMHKNLNVNGIIDPCPAQKIKTLVTGGVHANEQTLSSSDRSVGTRQPRY